MKKKLIMHLVAIMATIGVYAEFLCSAEVGVVVSGSANRKGTVTWRNTGSLGVSAPYVRVTAGDGVLIRLSDADAWGKSIEFLATSASLPASTLKAGEEGSLVFSCQSESDDGKLELSWTLSSAEAFPWAELGASLKPSYVSSDAWTFALSTLKTRFGTTWDTYLTRLRANADYLAGLGRSVNRIDRLMQIEIGRALGVDAVLPVIDSATDAGSFARGISLAFSRTYSSAMYSRFTSGILGYGWTDNYSAYAELTDDKTLVFRLPGGGSYSFTKETGSWQPEDARDKTVLSESSSAYSLTYQNGTVQTFAKSNMRIASIADNSGNAITFTWNGTNLTKATHTDGQSLIFDYSNGLLSSVTDDCGRKTQYTYSNSLLTKVTFPEGLTVSYEYRPVDNTTVSRALSRIVYPDGTTREFTYDTSSGLVSEVSVNGGKEKTTIARTDSVVTLTSADGAVTTIKTGVSGEVLETVDALGGVTAQEYTEDGLLKAIVSPSGLAGSITHDTLGRVSKSASAAGTETAFSYESTFGNLKTVTDAKNHAITYGYDSKGRGTSVSFVDGSSSKLEYNDRGDIVKSTNRRGESISYQYDSKGRLTKKTWANGRTFTYDYDARGNITTALDSETGAVTMRYDSVDRIIKIVYPTGRGFEFVYDSCGRLSSRISLDGAEECFTYDASGRIATVTDGKSVVYLKNTYDAATGRLTKQENGNGTSVSYLYDKLGRIVSIEHRDAKDKIVESLQYCYDADGRCIRAASLLGEERYGYDKDGQLTSVEYPDDTEEAFVYDAVGNRASRTGEPPVQNETYTINNLNQYTEIVNAQAARSTMTYDKDGNMTSLTDADGTTSYYYDTLNRLIAVTNTTKNIRWSCTYDVFGNRVSVTDNGVTTERTYLQGALPSVAAEYVNGELKERHIVVGAVRVADLITNNSSLTTKYYHADLIGSTRLVTDGNGGIVNRCAYKAFGETRIGEESVCGYVGALGVETDSTGLLFMRNRYYSPSLGRFIQMDPIGLNGGDVNFFVYVGNSPIIYMDVDGLQRETVLIATKNIVKGEIEGEIKSAAIDKTFEIAGISASLAYWDATVDPTKAVLIENGVRNVGRAINAINNVKGKLDVAERCGVLGAAAMVGFEEGRKGGWFQGIASATKVLLSSDSTRSWASIGIWGGEVVANAVITISEWFKPSKKVIINVVDNPDIGGGGGGSGGGGGAIMNESDWIDIMTNKNINVGTTTFSLGADITLSHAGTVVYDVFSGKLNGNGHTITSRGVVFKKVDGAQFENVVFLGTIINSEVNNCSFKNVEFRDSTEINARECTFESVKFTRNSIKTLISSDIKNITFESISDWCIHSASNCSFDSSVNFGNNRSVSRAEKCLFNQCKGVSVFSSYAEDCTFTSFEMTSSLIISSQARNCEFKNIKATLPDEVLIKSAYGCKFESCAVDGNGSSASFANVAQGCIFSNCTSSASIVGSDSCIGGLVQESTSNKFTDCEFNGEITGTHSAGGIVGNDDASCFTDCSVSGDIFGGGKVGGFVSQSDGSAYTNCLVRATVYGGEKTGGFIGSSVNDVFTNCTFNGIVEGTKNFVGGFSGACLGSKFYKCESTGSEVIGIKNIGGFVGQATGGTNTACIANNNVKGLEFIGGFAGIFVGGTVVTNCAANGNVKSGGYAGGFVGQVEDSTIVSCLASGKVEEEMSLEMEACYFGGFVGHADGAHIKRCKSLGQVSAVTSQDVGGFSGLLYRDSTVQECVSVGNVTGGDNVGGFSGVAHDTCLITDCLASGSVIASGIGYMAHAGGLVGCQGSTLIRCYASGSASVPSTLMMAYSGGLAPLQVLASQIDMLVQMGMLSSVQFPSTSCYWNIGTTGQKYSGTGTGLTAANAKKQSSYAGWDFVNTWKMGSNGPELRDIGPSPSASAASVRTGSRMSASQGEVGENSLAKTFSGSTDSSVSDINGVRAEGTSPAYSQGTSADENSPLMSATSTRSVSSRATATAPRLYCYERYVLVRGYSYEFELSNEGDDAISVSGLPSGLTFANGVISGVVTLEGTSTTTISLTGTKGIVSKSIPFVVIAPPEDFEDETLSTCVVTFNANGGVVSPSTYTANVGSEIGTLPVPTLNGYVFDGWYTSATEGVKVTSSTVVTENLTLYARWKSTAEIKPDLIVSSVKLSKSIISLSDSVTLTCTVSNRGTADSNQSYTKFSYCNVNKHDPCPKLKAGEEYTHTITLLGQNLGIGTHTILVNADETNNNNENNESNNTDRITIKVSTPDPDPTSNVDWAYMALYNTEPDAFYLSTAPNLQKSSVNFEYGQSIYVQMGFYNSKRVSTRGEVRVRFSLNTGASTYVSWANLEKDRMAILTEEGKDISILQNLAPGNYTLTSVIDYNSLWRESNEENNIRTISFTVTSPAITCIVTLNANGGSVSTTSHSVVSGSAVGRLPRPSRNGYKFVGWFTSPTEGVKVTESTIVTENITYYAHWTLSEEDYNNALYAELLGEIPTSAASVYDGYIYQGDEIIGTIQSKVAKPKNGIAKVTAIIQIIGEKKVSIKSELDVDSGILVAYAKDGRELYLELGFDGMTGNFDGYDIDGARNLFDSKDKSEKSTAEEILKPYLGAYSMILDGGILSVTIAKKGKVTIKGAIDGNKVSAKAQALIGEDMICIPVIYSKKSVNLAFTIWLPINGGDVEIIGLDDAIIGKAGTLKNGAKFIIDGDIGASIETEDPRTLDLLPDNETITVSKSKWLVADGVKPAKVAYKKGEFTITEGKKGAGIVNPSGLKLSYKSKDGSFTGSFTAYAIVKGKLKKHKATVEGILIGDVGYGTITIKKIGTWGVTIE